MGVSDRFGCDRIHTHARNRAYLEHVVLGGAHDEGGPTGTRGQPGTPDRRSRGRQADARGPSGGGERWARGCVRTKGRGREHRRVHGSDRDARARSCVADGDTTSQMFVPGEQKCITTAGQRVPLRMLPLDEHDCRHLNFLLKYITRLRSRTACVAADRARPVLPRPLLLQRPPPPPKGPSSSRVRPRRSLCELGPRIHRRHILTHPEVRPRVLHHGPLDVGARVIAAASSSSTAPAPGASVTLDPAVTSTPAMRYRRDLRRSARHSWGAGEGSHRAGEGSPLWAVGANRRRRSLLPYPERFA